MRIELHRAARTGAWRGPGPTLTAGALLSVLVIIAAGISGTSHFAGPRWYPHLGSGTGRAPATHLGRFKAQPKLPQSPSRPVGGLPTWALIAALVAVGLLAGALLWRWLSRRRAPVAPGRRPVSLQIAPALTTPAQPEPEVLLTGVERALQVLDELREPSDAVVRAWLGLQETAEASGIVRQPSETPTEFTSRILGSAFADDRAIGTLLVLYQRTRFGDHPVSAGDVALVRDALQRLVATWGAGDPASIGSGR